MKLEGKLSTLNYSCDSLLPFAKGGPPNMIIYGWLGAWVGLLCLLEVVEEGMFVISPVFPLWLLLHGKAALSRKFFGFHCQ